MGVDARRADVVVRRAGRASARRARGADMVVRWRGEERSGLWRLGVSARTWVVLLRCAVWLLEL